MEQYGGGSDGNHTRAAIINDLRKQIANERTALMNLLTDLEGSALPRGATVSHALAFAREEVSLKEMAGLIDKGLKLDQTQTVRGLEGKKPSTAYNNQSGGYRILADLEKYHAACAARPIQANVPSATIRAVEDAVKLLEKLDTSTQAYLQAESDNHPSDPYTEALKDLRVQIPLEREVLNDLLYELKKGIPLPGGADLSQALAFARAGVSLEDMTRLMASGLSPNQADDARKRMNIERGERVIEEFASLAPEQRKVLLDEFTQEEIVMLEISGLGIDGGKEYRRLGIPITPQTIVTERTDAQSLGDMAIFGSGACNEVYLARYSGPEGIVQSVFKPLSNTESAWVAQKIGIDLEHPQVANRNLATQDVARALGFDVVVDCQIGSRRPPGAGMYQVQLGLVMERAPGKAAGDTPPEVFMNPEVRREITKLQLLDHLVGQGDRHKGNYFIHMYQDESGQTKAKVSGIDNDQCFGQNTRHGNDISYSDDPQHHGFRGTKMPELIDTDMAAALRSLTPERLTALLGDKLSGVEVRASHMRLQSVLDHVSRLEKNNQVITSADWNARAVMNKFHTDENSYFARDARLASMDF